MKQLYEIFQEFENLTKREDRKEFLLKHNSQALTSVLFFAFEPSVKFAFNHAFANYKPTEFQPGTAYSNLNKECRKFHYFIKDHPTMIKDQRSGERNLLSLLEVLEHEEAMVVMGMMRKDLKVKGLTYLLVRETFPNLPWSNK